jgi:hypothetical protein
MPAVFPTVNGLMDWQEEFHRATRELLSNTLLMPGTCGGRKPVRLDIRIRQYNRELPLNIEFCKFLHSLIRAASLVRFHSFAPSLRGANVT